MSNAIETPSQWAEARKRKIVFWSTFANLAFLGPLCLGALVRGYGDGSVLSTSLLISTPFIYAAGAYFGARKGSTPVHRRAVLCISTGCFAVWCMYLFRQLEPPSDAHEAEVARLLLLASFLAADGYLQGLMTRLTPLMAITRTPRPAPWRRAVTLGAGGGAIMVVAGLLHLAAGRGTLVQALVAGPITAVIVGLLHCCFFKVTFAVGDFIAEPFRYFDGVTPHQHPVRPLAMLYGLTIFWFSLLIFLVGSFDGAFSGDTQPLPYLDCLYLSVATITTGQANVNATSRLAQFVLGAELFVGVVGMAVALLWIMSIRQHGPRTRPSAAA